MNPTWLGVTLCLALSLTASPASAAGLGDTIPIPGGSFKPFYTLFDGVEEVKVEDFRLDPLPVTNQEFLAFTQAHPEWRRGTVPGLFVDGGYLSHWASPQALGPKVNAEAPVTRVSWFAAKAYCEAKGMRLPSELEWEFAAAASERAKDGREDPKWQGRILSWYARPTSGALGPVGQEPPNAYGVKDLHGLIWEWVLEFNSTLVSSDSREGGGADATQFCGAGAVSASDKADYASFMRYAFRSALSPAYTTGTLGFRCAIDGAKPSGDATP